MQEAYRPQRMKYSLHMLSYIGGGGGVGTLDGGEGRYLGQEGRSLGRGVGTLDGGRYLGRGVGTLDGG